MKDFSHIDDNGLCLTPRSEKIPYPQKLKRSDLEGLDATRWEELCMAASENEQSDEINSLLNNSEFKQDVSKYKHLQLKANKSTLYPNKNSLKKHSPKFSVWIGIAAAIAILIAVPLIISRLSTPKEAHRIASIPYTPNKVQVKENVNNLAVENIPTIAQASSPVVKTAPTSKTQNKATVSTNVANSAAREPSLNLTAIEPTLSNITIASNTPMASIVQSQQQEVSSEIVLLTSLDDIEHIEVERPNIFDWLKERSIVNINKLLGGETVVVREFDNNGKITLYAVQSKTLNFEVNYIK